MRTWTLVKLLAVCAVLAAALILLWSSSTTPAHAADVIQVTTGHAHSCALLGDGTVKCWGSNSDGQLGDGSTTDRTTPVNVSGLTGVASISAGERYTCAVTTGGGAKCWGDNEFGQLGDASTTDRTTPVDVSGLTSGVASIAAGGVHTCAVTTAGPGGAKCWGLNITGQLGNGSTTSSTTPVDVSGLTSGVASIAAGGFLFWGHSCAATTGGGAKCWGSNDSGELGDGTTTGRLTPVDVSGLTSGIASITVGTQHSCALTTGGGAKCWGKNVSGQLGEGSTTDRTTPVNVSGLTSGVASVEAGTVHTCAVTTGGGAKCWGANNNGKLGDGTTNNRTTPVGVSGLTSGVASIAGGGTHSCAVMAGGSVRCWGSNSSGQLGNGTTNNSTTPVSVSTLEKPVGGITEVPDVEEGPLQASEASGSSVGRIIAIAAAAAAGAVALTAAAWFAWRRRSMS